MICQGGTSGKGDTQSRGMTDLCILQQGSAAAGLVDLTSGSPDDSDVLLVSATMQPGGSVRKKRRVALAVPRGPSAQAALQQPEEAATDPQCAICMDPMEAMACGPCG